MTPSLNSRLICRYGGKNIALTPYCYLREFSIFSLKRGELSPRAAMYVGGQVCTLGKFGSMPLSCTLFMSISARTWALPGAGYLFECYTEYNFAASFKRGIAILKLPRKKTPNASFYALAWVFIS